MTQTPDTLLQATSPGTGDQVRIEIRASGRVDLILNRPDKHNAFNASVIADLLAELTQLAGDDRVKLLVLRSEGRHFSAGADLEWMRAQGQASHADNLKDASELARLMESVDRFPCPVICRIQGSAFGGALGLIACCDIAIASQDSRFCLSEVKLGLAPAVISPYVNRAIGARWMRRYTLTADLFGANDALAMGLVHQVVETEALDTAVTTQVERLLLNGPQAMRTAKHLLAAIDQRPITPELTQLTTQTIADLRVSAEGQEGLTAFLNKRKPAWQGEPSA